MNRPPGFVQAVLAKTSNRYDAILMSTKIRV